MSNEKTVLINLTICHMDAFTHFSVIESKYNTKPVNLDDAKLLTKG
jgi:hypothetical protein